MRFEALACADDPPVRIPPYDTEQIRKGLREIADHVDANAGQSDTAEYHFFNGKANDPVTKAQFKTGLAS